MSFSLFSFVFTTPLSADTVILKNGNQIRGILVKEDDRKVVLQFDKEATVEFARGEVEKIIYDPESAKAALRAEWQKKTEPLQTTVQPETMWAASVSLPPLSTGKESEFLLSEGKWQVRKTQHFIVYHQDPIQGKAIADRAEYHLEKIVDDLHIRRAHDAAKKYTVVIVKEKSKWEEFLKKLGIQTELTGGFTTGAVKREIFLHSDALPELQFTFPHEFTHVMLGEMAKGRKIPLWFDEGFANYEGGVIGFDEVFLTESRAQGKWIPLLELIQTKSYPPDIEKRKLFYSEAERLVEFLITQYSRRRFGEFTEALLNTGDIEKAIHSAYGGKIGGFDELNRLWLKYLSE